MKETNLLRRAQNYHFKNSGMKENSIRKLRIQ